MPMLLTSLTFELAELRSHSLAMWFHTNQIRQLTSEVLMRLNSSRHRLGDSRCCSELGYTRRLGKKLLRNFRSLCVVNYYLQSTESFHLAER